MFLTETKLQNAGVGKKKGQYMNCTGEKKTVNEIAFCDVIVIT